MRNLIFVAVFFLGIIHSLMAQQWVEMGVLDTLQINLALKNKRDKQQTEINKIVRAIAYTHQKPLETVAVSWKVMLSYQVMREDKGQFKSQIFIKPFVPQGNTDLYGIESSAYILPKLTSFRLRIFKEDSSLVYLKYYRNQELGAESAGEIADVFMWHQRWSKGWYMQADQFVFEFNQAKYTFEEWFQMANNYQAANFLVDQLLKDYDALQLKEQEPLTFLMKSIRQANFLKKLFQQDFYKELVLGKNDPQNLDKKMIKLSTLYDLNIEKYGRFLIQNRQDIRVEDLVNTYLLEDENLIKLKTEYTSIYDDLFTKLIHSNYPSNIAFNDFSFFSLNSNGSSSDYNESLILFETSLFDKSMSKIESLISNQYFTEALYTIDNLESFVKNSKELELNAVFKQQKAIAAYGMYNSYVHVVDQALKFKNTELAVQYLNKASVVQANYPKEIITNSLVEKKLATLIDICFSQYLVSIEKNEISKAAIKRDSLRELINTYRLEGKDQILENLNAFDNQALKK